MGEARSARASDWACDWWAAALDGFSRPASMDLPFYRFLLAKDRIEHVVELGAGTGRLSLPLISDGYHYTAIEPEGALRTVLSRRISALASGSVCLVLNAFESCAVQGRWQEGRTAFILPYNVVYYLESPEEVACHIGTALEGGCHSVLLDVDDLQSASPFPFRRAVTVSLQTYIEEVWPAAGDPQSVRVRWQLQTELPPHPAGSFSLRLHRPEEITGALQAAYGERWSVTQYRLAPAGPDLLLRIGPPSKDD